MPRSLKLFTLFCMLSVSVCFTLAACYWVAEHYFFDKFFFQKSEAHGYWVVEDSTYHRLAGYGTRAQDMLALEEFIYEQKDPRILGTQATNEFTIALYGDSYVWGVGVREQERFADLLEKKLNEYRPTKVLVFAIEGDNIVDQWRKYKAFLRTGQKADLSIFGIVHNDAFLKKYSWYGPEGEEELEQCEGETVWDVSEDWAEIDVTVVYPQRVKRSLEADTKNWCIVQKLLPDFPKKNALYVSLDSLLTSNPDSLAMTEVYKKAGFPVLTFKMPAPDNTPEQQKMFVSKSETHPSVLAHRIYADEITKTLLQDPRFGFIER